MLSVALQPQMMSFLLSGVDVSLVSVVSTPAVQPPRLISPSADLARWYTLTLPSTTMTFISKALVMSKSTSSVLDPLVSSTR